MNDLHRRFCANTCDDDPTSALDIVPGDATDYEALSRFHYREGRPATFARVLKVTARAAHDAPENDCGFDRRTRTDRPIAVLVESIPTLHCRQRDAALGGRYTAWTDRRVRGSLISAELRCISRVIVHPQWRGIGLATRLVNHALVTATTTYTEAIAAMGIVHPFFERAGMTAFHRPPHPRDAQLTSLLKHMGFSLTDFADIERFVKRLRARSDLEQRLFLRELRYWHGQTHRRARSDTTLEQQLVAARQRLACQPVYYLHDNR